MVHASRWLLTNRMNELFTSGSVGGAAGNRCLYPAPDQAERARKRRLRGYVKHLLAKALGKTRLAGEA